jgi:ATPase subunit of ABC transporter with duplicated ATPase domains
MRVQLAAVSKRYGAQVVLEHVDLTIGPHARVGIVGPNGVGKTTLLRILAGVEQPDGGSVVRAPSWLTSGYLAQERSGDPGLAGIAAYRLVQVPLAS